jgi:sugar/nucleoside kinase (ribokinase family)
MEGPNSEMAALGLDIVCIGHAIVDRLARVEDGVLVSAGIERGAMTLVDEAQIAAIESLVPEWVQVAGGSAANTAVGLASFGEVPTFVGSVGDDLLGAEYESYLEAVGVHCVLSHGSADLSTGQCLVLVDDESGRSMATNLGSGVVIDVEAAELGCADGPVVVYIEGYLLDSPETAAAVERAAELAKGGDGLVALSLSDPFVVERHHELLRSLVESKVDLLFANGEEARCFTGAPDVMAALDALEVMELTCAVTLGEHGAVILSGGERAIIEARPVERVEDTTGAGDLFAAGVLHGIVRGAPLETAGRLGALAAAEIISHLGAQPRTPLRALAEQSGLGGPWK